MEKKKENKKGVSAGAVVGIGAGIAALAAASYVLFGKDGKKNRKAIKGWAIKMKGEIIEKMEEAKEITEPMYHQIIDEIKDKYSKIKNIDQKDLDEVTAEIKKHWKAIKKDAMSKAKKTTAKKSIKKDSKK